MTNRHKFPIYKYFQQILIQTSNQDLDPTWTMLRPVGIYFSSITVGTYWFFEHRTLLAEYGTLTLLAYQTVPVLG